MESPLTCRWIHETGPLDTRLEPGVTEGVTGLSWSPGTSRKGPSRVSPPRKDGPKYRVYHRNKGSLLSVYVKVLVSPLVPKLYRFWSRYG